MSTVKLPYWPSEKVEAIQTRFGNQEISKPYLYDEAIPGRHIVRIDLMECLRPILGSDCLYARKRLYDFVSGNSDDATRRKLLAHYYRKHKDITLYINELCLYGDDEVDLLDAVQANLKQEIDEYTRKVAATLDTMGYKYLTTTHNYLYYASKQEINVPLVGAKVIC